MQKQDLAVFIVAISIVFILAFVIKPMMDGESVIPAQNSGTASLPSKIDIPKGSSENPYTPSVIMETNTTPTPVWDGTAQNVQFVDPSTYNIEWEGSLKDFGYAIPADSEPESNEMVLYATINGQWDATTQIINIPFPYWEIDTRIKGIGDVGLDNNGDGDDDYVEGFVASGGESLGVDPSNMHLIFPWINVQVMNADNPEGPVYILNTLTEGPVPIEIDKSEASASKDNFPDQDDDDDNNDTDDEEIDTIRRDNLDEYKWVHGFYEGAGNYYFIINPNMLESYTIDVYVPKKFLET